MTDSSAQVRFGSAGVAQVASFVHLTGHSYIGCFTYDDQAPVLAIKDQHIDVSITAADRSQVTDEDLLMARVLAEAVAEYVAELERRATAATRERTADPGNAGGRQRDGPINEGGRLELVPPAAPGFSPVTGKEEVTSVCARW